MLTDLEVFALRAERLPQHLRALLYPELTEKQHPAARLSYTDTGHGRGEPREEA